MKISIMMKTVLGLNAVLLTASLLIGCSKVDVSTNYSEKQFIAFTEDNSTTKVSFGESNLDGYHLLWEDNDNIAIFSGSNFNTLSYYTITSGSGTGCGIFSLDEGETEPESGPYMSLYPSKYLFSVRSDSSIVINYPNTIKYKDKGIASGFYPLISVESTEIFGFKNIFGILEIQLYSTKESTINTIEVYSPDEKLTGKVRIKYNNGEPIVEYITGYNNIILACENVELSQDKTLPTSFMIPLPPREEGYNMSVTISGSINGQDFQSTVIPNKTKTAIHRGKITKMPLLCFDSMIDVRQKDINIFTEVFPDSVQFTNTVNNTVDEIGSCINTTGFPTISDIHVTGTRITGLAPNTVYYIRGYAKKNGITYYDSRIQCIQTAERGLEYIENDILLGYGIRISNTVWAPVNCGTISSNGQRYKYGKWYQWGRKQGQGPITSTIELSFAREGNIDDFYYEDENGNNVYVINAVTTLPKANTLYSPISDYADWMTDDISITPQLTEWVKTTDSRIGDPCPNGWRIPTKDEWKSIEVAYETYIYDNSKGSICTGKSQKMETRNFIFLPFTGMACLHLMYPSIDLRRMRATQTYPYCYWSSLSKEESRGWVSNAFDTYYGGMNTDCVYMHVDAMPIRCVKE